MNRSFKEVVDFFKPNPKLTHVQQVTRLYRKSLRLVFSWSESRDIFNLKATEIRNEFNSNYKVNSAQAIRLLREGNERLSYHIHPDPYISPHAPGGTSFMRNPAVPLQIVYPNGIPANVSRRRMNIDMSYIPDDQPYADKVFVDSISKSYWIDK